jgi:hypothetical protein
VSFVWKGWFSILYTPSVRLRFSFWVYSGSIPCTYRASGYTIDILVLFFQMFRNLYILQQYSREGGLHLRRFEGRK